MYISCMIATLCANVMFVFAAAGSASLGRQMSHPAAGQSSHRSSSDPDLPGNNPDLEVDSIMGEWDLLADRAVAFYKW